MRFKNIPVKKIYLKNYRRQDAGQISIDGLIAFLDITLKISLFTFLPVFIYTFLSSYLPVFGVQSFVIPSASMEPSLSAGSLVISQAETEYRVKDIISYKVKSDRVVTSRIVDKLMTSEGIAYRVKGDSNTLPDSDLIVSANVYGRAVTFLPYLGFIIDYSKTPSGFIMLILIPAFAFIGSQLWIIKQKLDNRGGRQYTATLTPLATS